MSPEQLREQLLSARIAGEVATTRVNNLDNIRRTLAGDEAVTFGIELVGNWSFERLLRVMVDKVGIQPDPSYAGMDTIAVDLTIDRLTAMRDRLRLAADRTEAVLFATGHPANLLPIHLAVAARLRALGCRILQGDATDVRFLSGVHALGRNGNLLHTHSPGHMRELLRSLPEPPQLVMADHGWAGAAGQLGIPTLGFADCNDPGLFVGEELGSIAVAVPLDDGVAPHLYDPLIDFLLAPLVNS